MVSGLALSSQVPGCLVTASADETVKVWDIQDNQPSFVVSRDLQLGKILNASCCPDSPFVFCFGGEKQGLRTFDITESAPVRRKFESRQRLVPSKAAETSTNSTETEQCLHVPEVSVKEEKPEPMEEESAANAMAALSLSGNMDSGQSKKKKKKRRM